MLELLELIDQAFLLLGQFISALHVGLRKLILSGIDLHVSEGRSSKEPLTRFNNIFRKSAELSSLVRGKVAPLELHLHPMSLELI